MNPRAKRILLILVLVLGGGTLGYRTYFSQVERERAEQLRRAEIAEADRQAADIQARAAKEAEAHRLLALKAEQDAQAAEAELARVRAEAAANESRRLAAEREAEAAKAELARLAREKELAVGESRRLAEEREKAALAADAARQAALQQIAQADADKRAAIDREQARIAALRKQQELERQRAEDLLRQAELLTRTLYPQDYKRRPHDYLDVGMKNAELTRSQQEPQGKPAPTATP